MSEDRKQSFDINIPTYIVAEHITKFSKHLEILIFYDNKH